MSSIQDWFSWYVRRPVRRFFVEGLPTWIAWRLPRRVVYFAAIRLMAYATTGKYSDTVVPELEGMDAIERWEAKDE